MSTPDEPGTAPRNLIAERGEIVISPKEGHFRLLAEALPHKIFTASPDGEIDYLNQQWAVYSGMELEMVKQIGWRGLVHPGDVDAKTAKWRDSMRTGGKFEFEHRLRAADGSYRWHLSRAAPVRHPNGSIAIWVGSNTDINDLKNAQSSLQDSESRSRLVIEASGMGFWDWRMGHSVLWSPEHNRLFELDPELCEGSPEQVMERIHPEDRAMVRAKLDAALNSKKDFEATFRVLLNDGAVRWLVGHGRAYFDSQTGEPVRMLGVVRDITATKHFEEELQSKQQALEAALSEAQKAREETEAAGRAKDQFLAVLSHELRTPLTPVLMAASMLSSDKTLSGSARSAVQMIQRNIQLEAKLIDDLLDLTRIARNKLDLRIEVIDLHQAVRKAVEVCNEGIRTKAQTLVIKLNAEHHHVLGDFSRLQQVFWNLINNAVKFSPENGCITIESSCAGKRIAVQVIDAGIGIPPDVLSRIFDPFDQGDTDPIHHYGGLGLGLAISRAIIDAHHGTVLATSAGRQLGATFRVELATTPALNDEVIEA